MSSKVGNPRIPDPRSIPSHLQSFTSYSHSWLLSPSMLGLFLVIIFIYVYVCVTVGLCHACRCPWKPEGDVLSRGATGTGNCEPSNEVFGTELGSSGRSASSLSGWAASPAPDLSFWILHEGEITWDVLFGIWPLPPLLRVWHSSTFRGDSVYIFNDEFPPWTHINYSLAEAGFWVTSLAVIIGTALTFHCYIFLQTYDAFLLGAFLAVETLHRRVHVCSAFEDTTNGWVAFLWIKTQFCSCLRLVNGILCQALAKSGLLSPRTGRLRISFLLL